MGIILPLPPCSACLAPLDWTLICEQVMITRLDRLLVQCQDHSNYLTSDSLELAVEVACTHNNNNQEILVEADRLKDIHVVLLDDYSIH